MGIPGAPPSQPSPPQQPSGGRARARGPLGTLIGVGAVATVLIAAVVAVAVVRPTPLAGLFDTDRPTAIFNIPVPTPSPVLAAVSDQAPMPTEAGLRALLTPLVADARLGARVQVSVVDVASGQLLFDHGAQTPSVPASTIKLLTAAAVLVTRGPSYRLATRAVAGAGPGEVVLVGGGDPTLAAGPTGTYPGAASLVHLAEQVRKAGVAPTKVIVDASLFTGPLFGPGWDADIATGGHGAAVTALMTDGARVNPKAKAPAARYARPDLAAGQAFAKAFGLPASAVAVGVAPAGSTASADPAAGVAASPDSQSGVGPPGQASVIPGTELGRVESPPMIRLVEIMLTDSDNVIAEALARQVALAKGEPASFAGVASAMTKVLSDLGLPTSQASVADGSGLSRLNRVTPSLLTDVLILAARAYRPELYGMFTGLPVAGYSGTLRDRFRGPASSQAGAGVVRAKTGTLTGVSAIAGIVVTGQGRLLAFAMLADRVPPVGPQPAQAALDALTAALAGCGCR